MTYFTKLTLSTLLICGLAACAAPTAHIEGKTQAEAKTNKFKPVATVKPGANVTMTSALPKSMVSGSFQTVQLSFDEAYSDGTMRVTIEPSAGLSLFGGMASKTFDMSKPGAHAWEVDVKADADGVYFLNVFAEAQGQPRTFSVRLDMGQTTQKMFDDAMPADGEITDGGKIRALDADETIQ